MILITQIKCSTEVAQLAAVFDLFLAAAFNLFDFMHMPNACHNICHDVPKSGLAYSIFRQCVPYVDAQWNLP
jgi:hypothetical protein